MPTPVPPEFDIVDHICDLPYLVLTVLFLHLPVYNALQYSNCANPEIRRLARAQRWREIRIHDRFPNPFVFSLAVVTSMIKSNTPPPFRIGLVQLEYSSGMDAVVPEWVNYLEQHAASVVLSIESSGAFLVQQPVNVLSLRNLTEVYFGDGLMELSRANLMGDLRLPQGLRVLLLFGRQACGLTPYRDLVIPHSVSYVRLKYAFDTVDEFPTLPPELQKLEVFSYRPVDAGPLVQRLPTALKMLRVCRPGKRPAAIQRLDLKRFPRLVEHSLDVVDGNLQSHACMEKNDNGVWTLSADGYTDYSSFTFPPGVGKLVVQGEENRIPDHLLDNVLGNAPELTLLTVNDVRFAPCNATALQVPKLTELVLFRCYDVPECSFLFATNVTSLLMSECGLRGTVPRFVRECSRLQELRISSSMICAEASSGSDFPVSLRRLIILHTRNTSAMAVATGAYPWSKPHVVDLLALVNLEYLDILNSSVTDWAKWRFPKSLKTLDSIHNGRPRTVSTLQLPLALEELRMESCNVSDFWSLCLPATLKVLDAHGSRFDPPPPGYQFPEGLGELNLSRCQLTSISGLGLPLSLRKLDLLKNELGGQSGLIVFPDGLEEIDVSNCGITDLSQWVFPLSLRKLDVRGNKLNGQSSLMVFPDSLEEIDVSDCGITDLSKWSFPLSLRKLDLDSNNLDDTPDGYAFLDGLEVLVLASQDLADLPKFTYPSSLHKVTVRYSYIPQVFSRRS